MAYLEGLTHCSQETLGETRAGVPLYNGTAHGLIEWRFKINNRKREITSIAEEDQKAQRLDQLVSKVIDGLSDEALKVAMDLTEEQLAATTAIDTLVAAMVEHVSKFKSDEARELFKAGSRTTGPLTRQRGETMSSYIARRRRWITRLKSLDTNTTVSENILADDLLDCAAQAEQILTVRTASNNESVFDDIAKCLRRQHAEIHLKESRGAQPQDRQPYKAFRQDRPAWKATNIRHPPKRHTANIAAGEYDDDPPRWTQPDAEAEEPEDEEDNVFAYNVVTCTHPEELSTIEEQIEQDIVVAFIAAGGSMDEEFSAE